MRRRLLLAAMLAVALGALPAAASAASKRTTTPVKVKRPSPGNATVAGFELRLLPNQPAKTAAATLRAAAVKLPKGFTVLAVLAKQKQSDRVRGVLVLLDRADAVAARAAAGSTVTIDLRHAAIPAGFRTTLTVKQRRNVLSPGHAFRCSSYFRASDLGGALSLGGPAIPNLAIRDAIVDACASARSRTPYAGENEFRGALNARSGFVTFTLDPALPAQLDGSATFDYPVAGFTVLADKGNTFTSCASAVASCQLMSKRHPNDYAVFTLASSPAPSNAPPASFTLGLSTAPTKAVPFEFFGKNQAGARFGPLLTSGP
jgi:hypothetical protein